jgi:hypothetical protein
LEGSRCEQVARSALLLLLTTVAVALALTDPGAAPLAAERASGACLDREARTVPVRINVGHRAGDRFRFLVTLDTSADPTDPDPAHHPAVLPTASSAPVLTEGIATGATTLLRLPEGCRWLVTVQPEVRDRQGLWRATTRRIWGAHVDLVDRAGPGYEPRDADANGDVVKWVEAIPAAPATGTLSLRVFADTSPTDGRLDDAELAAGGIARELDGFTIELRDASGAIVTATARGDPLCGGGCVTARDGTLEISGLAPGSYSVQVRTPDDARHPWYAATPTAALEEDELATSAAGSGAGPGSRLSAVVAPLEEPVVLWFGFAPSRELPGGPGARIRGCAVHAASFPPFESRVLNTHEPIDGGWAALSRLDTGLVHASPLGDRAGCPGGALDIRGVPPGSYALYLWDRQLEHVGRRVDVTVQAAPGREEVVDLPGDDGSGKIGLLRRFGWLSGLVFEDLGVAADGTAIGGARNGVRDCADPARAATCEPGLANQTLELRFRDGSVKASAVTGPDGRYEFPAEVSALSQFVTFALTSQAEASPCLYADVVERRGKSWRRSQYNPAATCVPLRSELGHGVSTSQLTAPGHRSTIDWAVGGNAGGGRARIAGVVYYATTRRGPDPGRMQAEPHEPGIAGVPVNLYWTGANQTWDGGPGPGSDDVLVDRYARGDGTDSFEHPTAANQGRNGGCDTRDSAGDPVYPAPSTFFGLRVGPSCLELGATSNQTKDGTFDGGYVFEDMCDPELGGWVDAPVAGVAGCSRRVPLAPGTYVVEVAAAENPGTPGFPYRVVKEEDANAPASEQDLTGPTPSCVGPEHVVRAPGSPFHGRQRPLCTHKQVAVAPGQTAPRVDFFLFTDTPLPARVVGRVTVDGTVDTDADSPRFGQPRAAAGVPVGIRDESYRLLETVVTDEYGSYEALLPASVAPACPSRSGVCPATYVLVLNDPEGERSVAGHVRVTGTSVRGTGTRFTSEVAAGNRIRVGAETRTVTSVASDTTLTVDRAFAGPAPGPTALYVRFRSPGFAPGYGTRAIPAAALPGTTALVETSLGRIAGPECRVGGPEIFQVEPGNGDGAPRDPDGGVVVSQSLPASSELRDVVVHGLGFGVERVDPGSPDEPGYVTLVHPSGTRYRLDDDSYYGGAGSPRWSDEAISFRFPRAVGEERLEPAPYQVLVTSPGRDPSSHVQATSPTGITLHYVGPAGHDPPRRYVDGASGADAPGRGTHARPYRTIQYAIDRARAERLPGALLIVAPGVYAENPVLDVAATLQGFGAGGLADATGVPGPDEDVRRSSTGTVIDASTFGHDPRLQARWRRGDGSGTSAAAAVPPGAGLTVVAGKSSSLTGPAIDGFAILAARRDTPLGTGGGGIVVASAGGGFRATNNVLAGNEGSLAGAIVLAGSDAARIAYNRIVGNGGGRLAGGIGILDGVDGYAIEHNVVCANVSAGPGGGISHVGRSERGRIAENVIGFNVAAGDGGGLAITAAPSRRPGATGTGNVAVERNVLSSNLSGEDGGAVAVAGAVQATADGAAADRIAVVNNQLTNNVAAGTGGAIALRDAPDVWIVNNTVAENASTATCRGCLAGPAHAGGLASREHSQWLRSLLPAAASEFSSPLLLNNLFSGNASYGFDPASLPALSGVDALDPAGLRDFEVLGRAELRFRPWYSTLSVPYEPDDDASSATVHVLTGEQGTSPFADPYATRLDVGFDAATGRAAIDVSVADRPDASVHAGMPGDYHLCRPEAEADPSEPHPCSTAPLDGAAASVPASAFAGTVLSAPRASVAAPTVDIDGDARPVELGLRSLSAASAYDIGADEAPAPAVAARRAAAPPPRASPPAGAGDDRARPAIRPTTAERGPELRPGPPAPASVEIGEPPTAAPEVDQGSTVEPGSTQPDEEPPHEPPLAPRGAPPPWTRERAGRRRDVSA